MFRAKDEENIFLQNVTYTELKQKNIILKFQNILIVFTTSLS